MKVGGQNVTMPMLFYIHIVGYTSPRTWCTLITYSLGILAAQEEKAREFQCPPSVYISVGPATQYCFIIDSSHNAL